MGGRAVAAVAVCGAGAAAGRLLPDGVQCWKTGRYGQQRRIAGDRVGGEDGEQVWEVAMRRGRGKAGCLVRGAGIEVCRALIDLRKCWRGAVPMGCGLFSW